LNSYGKSLNIVFAETGYKIYSLAGFRLYLYLMLSSSFFNACVESGIEKLKSNAEKLFLEDEGFLENQSHTNYVCYELIALKRRSDSGITYEIFFEKLKEIAQKNDISTVHSELYQLFYENFPELTSNINHFKEKRDIYFAKIICFLIYWYLPEKREQQFEFQDLCFDFLFEQFYRIDRVMDTDTPEEIKFATKRKENIRSYWSSNAPVNYKKNKLIKDDLDLAIEIIMQKKLPPIVDLKTYDNRGDVYRALEKLFKFYLDDIPEEVFKYTKIVHEAFHRDDPKDSYNFLSQVIFTSLYYSHQF
jgi:hypothetical protein